MEEMKQEYSERKVPDVNQYIWIPGSVESLLFYQPDSVNRPVLFISN
ncbi:hypothetical protein JMA_15570 [Jeotgalibacillus malaysiensis]|uniref:Uncharacterized protein n=1 Tax=Jeotgalibacillus malaysiensis TaxID=1508404 RepID=A0A0B5AS85_9BACL|nr:hypothetical protein JMA_15570 [Jeotgalibacillus malaysiensis]